MLRKRLCARLSILAFLATSTLLSQSVFVTSGESTLRTYTLDPLSFATNVTASSGAFTVLSSGTANKFYLISRSGNESVTVLSGRFPSVTVGQRLAQGAEVTAAAVTPDGRRLIVVGGGVQIFDTSNDRVVSALGNLDVGTNPIDVAVSLDSSRAYVLSADSARLTSIDLNTMAVLGNVAIGSLPTAVTVGPNGVLYVSAQNAIYEIDARSLAIRATIQLTGQPGKLQFTPDGLHAVALNQNAFTARSAFVLDVAKRTVGDVVISGIALTDIAVIDNTTAYGVGGPNSIVYTINLNFGDDRVVGVSPASFGGVTLSNVTDLAVSGQLPRSQYLLAAASSGLQRINLQTNELAGPIELPGAARLHVLASPGVPGSAASIIQYNATQTAAAGQPALPVSVRILDQNGFPVSGVSVTFSTTTAGISPVTTTSSLDGIAAATFTVPAGMTTGSIPITASVANGARTAQFTINVGDPGLPGPGPGGPGAPVRGLTILSGHGQAVSENLSTSGPGQSPLRVRLLDVQGNPVSGATVSWRIAQGNGNVQPQQTTTNSDGITEANFTSTSIQPGLSYFTNVITATASTGDEAQFLVTTIARGQGQVFGTIQGAVVKPVDFRLVGKAGETAVGALQFQVVTTTGATPVPNIGLRLISGLGDTTTTPPAQCRGGIALSNAQGLVSCDVVFGPNIGEYAPYAEIGGGVSAFPISLRIEQGGASRIIIRGSNTRTGVPGQQVDPALDIQVVNAAGFAIENAPVQWDVPNTVTIVSVQNRTDANGRATLTLRLGQTPGTFTVRARSGDVAEPATFTITSALQATSITKVSGDNQSAVTGQPFAQPLQVRLVDAAGAGAAGASVSFAVTSGSATLSQQTVTADAQGNASVQVTAGSSVGPVIVSVTAGSLSASFNLTVRTPGPVFTAADVLNGASFQPGISPGSIAYIRARGIATGVQGTMTPQNLVGPLPTRLADVEVLFNNTAAPIFSVSNIRGEESVVVQVPYEVNPGNATVTIRSAGGASTTANDVPVRAFAPGVFESTDSNGRKYAVTVRSDGSYVSSSNPARRGEIISIFATGLGQTSPATGTNRQGSPGQAVVAPLIVGLNNAGVRLVSAQLLPGTFGVYIVSLEVPTDTQTGDNQPVGLGVVTADGSVQFSNGTTIPIQ
jgi:uncharacterized protein (TIGR03437 family)